MLTDDDDILDDDDDDEDIDLYAKPKGRCVSLVKDYILKYVGSRSLKVFHEIYHDVINDYGSITQRSVYRVLAKLIKQKQVVRLSPPGRSRRGRPLPGGYVRGDSPLLAKPGGEQRLLQTLNRDE